jgi:hypothetical protein
MEEAHFRHNIHSSFQLTNLTFTVNRRVIFTPVQGRHRDTVNEKIIVAIFFG